MVPNSFVKDDGTRYNSVELRVVGLLDENQARRVYSAINDAVRPDRTKQQQQQDSQADQLDELNEQAAGDDEEVEF